MIGQAMLREQIGEAGHHVVAPQTSGHHDRQAFATVLVDHDEHLEGFAVIGAILHEVVAPDMVRPARPKADAGPVVQPKPGPLGLSTWNLEPLASPDPLHTAKAHLPALKQKKAPDTAITVAAIHPGQPDNRLGKRRLISTTALAVALGRAMLTDHTAGATLGDPKNRLDVVDAGLAARGAQ